MEAFFRTYLSEILECPLIVPLAVMWRDKIGEISELKATLARWLRLIYPGDASGSKDRNTEPPARFPKAETEPQLRLSYAAISIISFRPDIALISDFVDCYYSQFFCYRDIEEKYRLPVKSSAEGLGVLLRWHFEDDAILEMGRMADGLNQQTDEWKMIHWVARLMRRIALPSSLGETKDIFEDVEIDNGFQRLCKFLDPHNSDNRKQIGFGEMEDQAVRQDLPLLNSDQISYLISACNKHIALFREHKRVCGTHEERELADLLPWLARYSPEAFNDALLELWNSSLSCEESFGRLSSLLIPPHDSIRLCDAILARGLSACRDHNELSAIRLTEFILFHATVGQQIEWFRILENGSIGLEKASLTTLFPLPTVLELLASGEFCTAVKAEVSPILSTLLATPDDQLALQRARHWFQIYSYTCELSDEEAKCFLEIMQASSDEDLLFAIFCIISKCKNEECFRFALFHPKMARYHHGRTALFWLRGIHEDTPPKFSFDELQGKTSLTLSGWLLSLKKSDNEIRAWGNELMGHASIALTIKESPPKSQIEMRLNAKDNLEGFGFENPPPGGGAWHSNLSPVWGIDRNVDRATPSQQDLELACRTFTADMTALRASSRKEFFEFNAITPLNYWSQLEPELFTSFAQGFIREILKADLETAFGLSYFTQILYHTLLRLDPKMALKIEDKEHVGDTLRVTVIDGTTRYGVQELWRTSFNKVTEITQQRLQLLYAAENDEEILWHNLSAHVEDNAPEIRAIAAKLARNLCTRDRALGVSLLAFQGDAESIDILRNISANDSTYWLREHALWAYQVCSREKECRELYRKVWETDSLALICPILSQLNNAMSPMAYAWRRSIEIEPTKHSSKINAYFKVFWHHWSSSSKHTRNIKHCGRTLKEFCRGERLKRGLTDRMAPWWDLRY